MRADDTIHVMKPTLEDGLRALREAAELARHIRIELTDDYLRLIDAVERMPHNQAGADKSHVWRLERTYREFFRAALLHERP